MLKKTRRVNKNQVNNIFSFGRFISSQNISLKYVINSINYPARVSFISPKSVSKNAVSRNLLRRRGYEVIKNTISSLPDGFIGVFIFGKKSISSFGGKKNISCQNMAKQIQYILNKIK
ncbi:MAG: ribonuclease P protein component [Candidatus Paceibacterota bacterium]|jgi:ribonuclease P protein component